MILKSPDVVNYYLKGASKLLPAKAGSFDSGLKTGTINWI
jgi:hypothetical protein